MDSIQGLAVRGHSVLSYSVLRELRNFNKFDRQLWASRGAAMHKNGAVVGHRRSPKNSEETR